MSYPDKILVPTKNLNDSQIVLDTDGMVFPEGFSVMEMRDGGWTLVDALGRINVTWMYQTALLQDPNLTNKSPAKWLENKDVKELRANYLDLIGFDPVFTVRGGKRGGDYQSQHSEFDNSFINVSKNGNVQTYGTYMTDRMFISYAQWVSFAFKCYVDDIFLEYSNNALSSGGLILSTDALHHENRQINARHCGLIQSILNCPPRYLHDAESGFYDVQEYIAVLRGQYNVDISKGEYLKWLWEKGFFQQSFLERGNEGAAVYKPKSNFLGELFAVVNAETPAPLVLVLPDGHNALITWILEDFPMIKPEVQGV